MPFRLHIFTHSTAFPRTSVVVGWFTSKLHLYGDDKLMVMHLRLLLSFVTLLVTLTSFSALRAEPSAPRLIKNIVTKDYKRVLGGPAGAFYFSNKSTIDVGVVADDRYYARKVKGNRKLVTSPQGNHFALLEYDSFRPTELEIRQIEICGANGDVLWSGSGQGCNGFILCDASPIAVGIRGAEGLAEAQLLFFDAGGNIVDSAAVKYFTRGRFSGDGRSFYAVSGSSGILRFNSRGKETGSFPTGKDYRVSFDGSWLAALSDDRLDFYDGDSLVAVKPVTAFSFRDLHFSSDGSRVVILFKDHLELLSLPDLETHWSYQSADSTFSFTSLDIDQEFTRIVCSASNSNDKPEERNARGQVALLDSEGNVIWSDTVTYTEWSTRYPEVRISPNHSLLSILTAEELRIYSF